MKGLARLTLLYIATFAFVLITTTTLVVLRGWILAACAYSPRSFSLFFSTLSAAKKVLPFSAYFSVLSAFIYSARHNIGAFSSALLIFLFSTTSLFVVTYGLRILNDYKTTKERAVPQVFQEKGVILRYEGADVVIIGKVAEKEGLAVISRPDTPLKLANMDLGPEFGLRAHQADFIASSLRMPASLVAFSSSMSRAAHRFSDMADKGTLPLLAYVAALSFLLASFRFMAGTTRWPLADAALLMVIFRLIMAYDDLVFAPVVSRFFVSIAVGVPIPLIEPAILAITGIFISGCFGLTSLAKERRRGNV